MNDADRALDTLSREYDEHAAGRCGASCVYEHGAGLDQLRARHAEWRPFSDVLAECDGWLDVSETDIDYTIELSCIAEMNAKERPAAPVRLNPTDGTTRCWPYTFHGYVSRRERPRTWRAFAVCRHGYAQEF